jgi:hypothetical protein
VHTMCISSHVLPNCASMMIAKEMKEENEGEREREAKKKREKWQVSKTNKSENLVLCIIEASSIGTLALIDSQSSNGRDNFISMGQRRNTSR